jgi:hypothetical protein
VVFDIRDVPRIHKGSYIPIFNKTKTYTLKNLLGVGIFIYKAAFRLSVNQSCFVCPPNGHGGQGGDDEDEEDAEDEEDEEDEEDAEDEEDEKDEEDEEK